MPIQTTGNSRIDTATSEMAIALRNGHPGRRDQYYYDWAMRLRNEILLGTLDMAGVLPPWRPANNGAGKHIWFLVRGWGAESDRIPAPERYHYSPSGKLIRYASQATAQRAADKLNKQEGQHG